MPISGVQQRIGVESVGVNVTLPQSDVAYVMYYLNCALKGCGLDIIQDDLVDWRNYHRLSAQRQDQVFLAAYKYSPDELLDKTIFLDDDGSVCNDKENVFLRITEDMQLFHAQAQVLIVGEQKRAASIMVFRKAWLEKFYTQPMKRNFNRLERAMIGLISNHCEHCAGRSGKCVCSSCPRTSESQCSPTASITGIMTALSDALEESLKEAKANSECKHCEHCKGLEASCGCEEGCFKPSKSKCIAVHKGILCDGCRDRSIVGSRFKCADCNDYDLCHDCYRGKKHDLSHRFFLIERVGMHWRHLEPRKPVPVARPPVVRLPPSPPQAKRDNPSLGSSTLQQGYFYEGMSIAEMKSYLIDNGVHCDDVFEKEDLQRKVWECYCDSVSAAELTQVIKDIGLDASGCRDITSRRNMVKAAFRAAQRPSIPSTPSRSGFVKDQIVVLCGLKTTLLNGSKATVVAPDVGNGKSHVLLEDGRTAAIKHENLVPDVELIE